MKTFRNISLSSGMFVSLFLLLLSSCGGDGPPMNKKGEVKEYIQGKWYYVNEGILTSQKYQFLIRDSLMKIWRGYDKDDIEKIGDFNFKLEALKTNAGEKVVFLTPTEETDLNDDYFDYIIYENGYLKLWRDRPMKKGWKIAHFDTSRTEGESSVGSSSSEEDEEMDEKTKTEIRIGNAIKGRIFTNYENNLKTSLEFESDNANGLFGSVILRQGGRRCKWVFTYTVEGEKIDLDFYESTCGRETSDKTLYYDENDDEIRMRIRGQRYTFD